MGDYGDSSGVDRNVDSSDILKADDQDLLLDWMWWGEGEGEGQG